MRAERAVVARETPHPHDDAKSDPPLTLARRGCGRHLL